MCEIRKISVEQIEAEPTFSDMLRSYGKEVSFGNGLEPCVDFSHYKTIEKSGCFHVLGCYHNGVLIGFMTVLVTVLPHWGKKMGVSESFFVVDEHRKTGAGLKLLHEGEQLSKELGAMYFLVSAPKDGRLSSVLPHVGYDETNRLFFKRLSDE